MDLSSTGLLSPFVSQAYCRPSCSCAGEIGPSTNAVEVEDACQPTLSALALIVVLEMIRWTIGSSLPSNQQTAISPTRISWTLFHTNRTSPRLKAGSIDSEVTTTNGDLAWATSLKHSNATNTADSRRLWCNTVSSKFFDFMVKVEVERPWQVAEKIDELRA